MTVYLTAEQVLFIHARLISETDGAHGVRDLGLLQSAVARPRATFESQDLYWEGVFTEEESRVPVEIYRLLGVLSHFGVTRITGFAASQAEGLPEESDQQAVAIGSTTK